MKSIFNTQRTAAATGRVASADYALVTVAGRSELVQSIQGQYGRRIESFHEVGSPNVNYVPGHEEGTLQIQRLVGKLGFFDGWTGDNCGVIRPVAVTLQGGPCVAVAAGGIQCSDTIVESVSFQFGSTGPSITESVSMRVGTMSRI
jgi:hypothetical protein